MSAQNKPGISPTGLNEVLGQLVYMLELAEGIVQCEEDSGGASLEILRDRLIPNWVRQAQICRGILFGSPDETIRRKLMEELERVRAHELDARGAYLAACRAEKLQALPAVGSA